MKPYQRILDHFRLSEEKEDYAVVADNVEKGVVFRGTNLWVLIFAIFVASLGLNVNSTAVIIGAMLISPLMGPIIGLGFGIGINDLTLVRKALYNYFLSAGAGLAASTLYFLISPLNAAHSELLARTSPTIYDVLIAFFGGLAGIVAISSKMKGNVIPGVAIATALMPPLCTAGYGLATFQLTFLFGALYLFIINTVFIALATLITVRLLRMPMKIFPDPASEKRARHIIWAVVLVTLLPSVYFGYDVVQQNKFSNMAGNYIKMESVLPNDYLLEKEIDPKKKSIIMVFGGKKMSRGEIDTLHLKLKNYGLSTAHLEIKQGFEYITGDKNDKERQQINKALLEQDSAIEMLKNKYDSIQKARKIFTTELVKEGKAISPALLGVAISPIYVDSIKPRNDSIAYLQFSKVPQEKERKQLENWLKVKLNKKIKVIFGK